MAKLELRMACYRQRRSGTEDPNAKFVDIGPVRIYFSYTTAVAFHVEGEPRVVRQNDWGPTTGTHLNAIDRDQSRRVSGAEFERLLAERVGRFFFPRDLDADAPAFVVADWLRDRGMDAAADAVQQTQAV